MTKLPVSEEMIVNYLLGSMPDQEAEQLDEMSITDDDFAEKLKSTEKDLVDAYVRKELSAEQMALFEKNFLITNKRREMVVIAETFVKFIDSSPPEPVRAPLQAVHAQRSSFLHWAVAAVALLLLGTAAYLLTDNLHLRKQIATLQREQIKTPAGEVLKIAAFHLNPEMRGLQDHPELLLEDDYQFVEFSLSLEPTDFAAFQVALRNTVNDSALWRSGTLSAKNNRLKVRIPAKMFASENYEIDVFGISSNGELQLISGYTFRITR